MNTKLARAVACILVATGAFTDSRVAHALTYAETACVERAYGEGRDPATCFWTGSGGGSAGSGSGSGSGDGSGSSSSGGMSVPPQGHCTTPSWFPLSLDTRVPGSLQSMMYSFSAEEAYDGVAESQNIEIFQAKPSARSAPNPVYYEFARTYRAGIASYAWTELGDGTFTGAPVVNHTGCEAFIGD